MDVYRTIFQQEWWLDTVTDGQYAAVTVRSGNAVLGWLPYVKRTRWGCLVSGMPFLTHTLGPVIAARQASAANELLRRSSIARELLEKLPKLVHFRQVLAPDDASTLGFVDFGCHVRVQFTFIAECNDLDRVWNGMRDKTRNLIRRSEELYRVDDAALPEEFLRMYEENCGERGVPNRYGDRRTARILAEAIVRGQGRIYLARDPVTGKPAAGIAVVWDSRYVYFLMSTRRLASHSGAVSHLLWNAMQDAHRHGLAFDFDGATNRGTYKFLSGFGGALARRHLVEKFNPLYHALDKLRASFYGNMKDPYAA